MSAIPRYSRDFSRFVWSPVPDVKKRLASESEELKSDTSNLEKKLHYLETTYKNSRDNLEQLFKAVPDEQRKKKRNWQGAAHVANVAR
ncbi:hypothetical protein SLS55_010691 [Diplodia seriata]|uniref:Uncharacterized protein n=1 Tax=Diplodia seriata TaxID=420778 RepID=A0ABR3BY85_9PEZI